MKTKATSFWEALEFENLKTGNLSAKYLGITIISLAALSKFIDDEQDGSIKHWINS